MTRRVLALSLVLFAASVTSADANPWTARAERAVARSADTPLLRPDEKRLLALDTDAVRADLADGRVEVPRPEGGFATFDVTPTQTLARPVAGIRTYAGTLAGAPATTAALDLTPQGFHATVRGPAGSWSVDPYTDDTYAAYPSGALPREFAEGPIEGDAPSLLGPGLPRAGGTAVTMRTFRLALVNDKTYAASAGNTPTTVLAAKATLVNRVNQVYEQDLGVRLVLDTSDALNLNTDAKATASPGFATSDLASCKSSTLTKATGVINNRIGAGSYDVGHVVLAASRGGLANLGVVGGSTKGAGCTGRDSPIGDAFAIDYLAHELGHQFDANHTFNGTLSNCGGGNRNAGTAVEPGSGSSVMAYAGICTTDNLQANSDPYFSQRSIAEVQRFLTADIPAVGTTVATTDIAPQVTAPEDAAIPPRTPFRLTAAGSDADGDPVTFSWEENDTGAAALLFTPAGASGPLFRIFSLAAAENGALSPAPGQNLVTTDPTRTFPDVDQIVAGRTNAATGACADQDLDCASEKLPATARSLRFRVTARDGRGGVAADDVALVVQGEQALDVTSQAADEVATGASTAAITWTPVDLGPVRVRFLTTEGRAIDLGVQLPDSGATTVRLPPGRTGRIEVGAMDGTYFDLSPGLVTTDGTPEEPPPPPLVGTGVAPAATPAPTAAPVIPALTPAPVPSARRTAPLCSANALVTSAARRKGVVSLAGRAATSRVTVRAGARTVRATVRRGRWTARIKTRKASTPVRVSGAPTVRIDRLISLRRKGSSLVGRSPGRARLVITRRAGCASAKTLTRVRAGRRGAYRVRGRAGSGVVVYRVRTADGRRSSLPLVVQ